MDVRRTRWLIISLFGVWIYLHVVSAQTETYKDVVDGTSVILKCNTTTQKVTWTHKSADVDDIEFMTVTERDLAGNQVSRDNEWTNNVTFTGTNGDIEIKDITFARDNGYFQCSFLDVSLSTRLDVFVPVRSATITPDLSTVPLRTNSAKPTIWCISSLSRPAATTVRWFIKTESGTVLKEITEGSVHPWDPNVPVPTVARASLPGMLPDIILEGNYLVCQMTNNVTVGNVETRSGPATVYHPPTDAPVLSGYTGNWSLNQSAIVSCSVAHVHPVNTVTFQLQCPGYTNSEITQLPKDITDATIGGNVTANFRFYIKKSLQNKQCLCTVRHIETDIISHSDGSGMFTIDFPYPPKYVNVSTDSFTGKHGTSQYVICKADRSNPLISHWEMKWSPNCGMSNSPTIFEIDSDNRAMIKKLVFFQQRLGGLTCACILDYIGSDTITDTGTFNITYDPKNLQLTKAPFTGTEGATSQVTCSVTNGNPAVSESQLTWSPDCDITNGSSTFVTDQSGAVTLSGTITLQRFNHGKVCKCALNYSNTVYIEESVTYSVTFEPKTLQLTPTVISGAEAESKEITCTADHANPPIMKTDLSWSQDCGVTMDASTLNVDRLGNSILKATVLLDKSKHKKTCTCSLDYQNVVKLASSSTFDVTFKPSKLELSKSVFTGNEGTQTTVTCTVDGSNPAVEKSQFSWSDDCGISLLDSNLKFLPNGNAQLSAAVDLKRANHGKTCVCTLNYLDSIVLTDQATFDITFLPTTLSLSEGTISGKEGDTKEIICSADDANPPIQKSNFDWSSDCGLSKTDSTFEIDATGNSIFKGSVVLKRENHAKICKCILKYEGLGEMSDSATFNIKFSPRTINLSQLPFRGQEGETNTVTCTAERAYPVITKDDFSWSKDCGMTIGRSSFSIDPITGLSTLSSDLLLSRDYHGKTCTCSLSYPDSAPINDSATFAVTFSPNNVRLSNNFSGNLNESKTIMCKADRANPQIKKEQFIWSLDCGLTMDQTNFGIDVSGRAYISGVVMLTRELHKKVCTCILGYFSQSFTDNAIFDVIFPPLYISLLQNSVTGKEGQPKVVICTAQASNPQISISQFAWSPECGLDIADSTFQLDQFGQSSLSADLELMREQHEKKCTCSVMYDNKLLLEDTAMFTVTYAPINAPTLTGYTGTYNIGDDIQMTCSVSDTNPTSGITLTLECPNYTINKFNTITKNRTDHSTPRPDRTHGDVSVTFQFTAQKSLHKRHCTCYAIHQETGYDQQTIGDGIFNITFPPTKLRISSNILTGQISDTVTLNCTVDEANPQVKMSHFSWSADCIEPVSAMTLVRDTVTGYVTVSRSMQLRKVDNGKHCSCSVNYGSVKLEGTATYDVMYPPTQVTIDKGPFQTFEDNIVLLRCTVDAANPPVTKSQFQWLGDCGSLKGEMTYRTRDVFSAYVTQSVQVSRDDDGKSCSCRVTTPAGVLEDTGVFDIQYSARIKVILQNQRTVHIQEGATLNLLCDISAKPQPTVWWNSIADTALTSLGGDRYQSTKTVVGIKRDQKGKYECKASNGIGSSDSVYYDVIVKHGSSQMSLLPIEAFSGVAGNVAEIKCSVDAANPAVLEANLNWSDKCRQHTRNTVFTPTANDGGAEIKSQVDLTRDLHGFNCACQLMSGGVVVLEESLMFDIAYAPKDAPTITGYENITNVDDNINLFCSVTDVNPAEDVAMTVTCPNYAPNEIHSNVVTDIQQREVTNGTVTGHFVFAAKKSLNGGKCTCRVTHPPTKYDVVATQPGVFNITYSPKTISISDASFTGTAGQNTKITCTSDVANPPVELAHVTFSSECGTRIGDLDYQRGQDGAAAVSMTTQLKKEMNLKTCSCVLSYYGEAAISDDATFLVTFAPVTTTANQFPNVIETNDVDITCDIWANPRPTVRWFYGVTLLTANRVVLRDNGDYRFTSVITIEKINRTKSGLYKCEADNGIGEASFIEMNLNVQFAPSIISTSQLKLDVLEGDSFTLICVISTNPDADVTWYFRELSVSNTQTERKGFEITSKLIVAKTELKDAGTYFCEGKSNIGAPTSATFEVNVIFSPKILDTIMIKEHHVIENTDFTMSCSVHANPRPSIAWFYGGQLINVTDNLLDRGNNRYTSDVAFVAVMRNQTGEYRCEAANGVGQKSGVNVTVDVQFATTIISRSAAQTDVTEGTKFTLTCVISSNPYATISWFYESIRQAVVIPTRVGWTQTSDFVEPTAEISDAGKYRCEAENRIGALVTEYFDVNVLFSPRTTPGKQNYEVLETHNVTITCDTWANPRPVISWVYRNASHATLQTQDVITVTGTHRYRSTVTLSTVQRDQAGEYTCVTNNGISDATSAVLNVDVQYPAVIKEHTPTTLITLKEDDSFTLTCIVSSNPPADISWYVDDDKIRPNNIEETRTADLTTSSFVMRKSKLEDAGKYRCEAFNGFGVLVSADFTVAVKFSDPLVNVTLNKPFVGVAGNNLTLTCTVTTVTETNSPIMVSHITWTGHCGTKIADIPLKRETNAAVVGRIVTLSRNDHGKQCICSYDNLRSDAAQDSAVFSVTYAPQIVNITSSTHSITNSTLTVTEGDNVVLTYMIWANPQPTVNVELNSVAVSGVTMTPPIENYYAVKVMIGDVSKSQKGQLKVVVDNGVGAAEDLMDVVVQYLPIVTITTSPANGTVTEGTLVTLTCTTNAFPIVTQVVLMQEDDIRSTLANHQIMLNLGKVMFKDMGTYVCKATNDVGTQSSSVDLSVLVPPKTPLSLETPIFTTKLHVDAVIYVQYISNPAPSVEWRTESNELIANSAKYTLETNEVTFEISGSDRRKRHAQQDSIHIHGYKSSLTIRNVSIEDVEVVYRAAISNDIGTNNFDVPLYAKDKPQTPIHFTVKCNKSDANIQWTSQFNGGANQTFILSHRIKNATDWNTTLTIPDPGMGKRIDMDMNNLNPQQVYEFTLKSQNLHNMETDPLSVLCGVEGPTVAPVLPSTVPPLVDVGMANWIYILIAVVCGLILIFLIILVVCCVRVRRRTHDQLWERAVERNAEFNSSQKSLDKHQMDTFDRHQMDTFERPQMDSYDKIHQNGKTPTDVTDAYDTTYSNMFLGSGNDTNDNDVPGDETVPEYSVIDVTNDTLDRGGYSLFNGDPFESILADQDDDDIAEIDRSFGILNEEYEHELRLDESATRM